MQVVGQAPGEVRLSATLEMSYFNWNLCDYSFRLDGIYGLSIYEICS